MNDTCMKSTFTLRSLQHFFTLRWITRSLILSFISLCTGNFYKFICSIVFRNIDASSHYTFQYQDSVKVLRRFLQILHFLVLIEKDGISFFFTKHVRFIFRKQTKNKWYIIFEYLYLYYKRIVMLFNSLRLLNVTYL